MSDTKPFAVVQPETSVADAEGFSVVIQGEPCCPPWGNWSEDGARNFAAAVNAAFNAALKAERERCARIVESYANTDPDRALVAAAAEIRGSK